MSAVDSGLREREHLLESGSYCFYGERAYCLSEDREDIGLRLAIVTLREFCPDETVYLYRPSSSPAFLEWLKAFPSVKLIPMLPQGAKYWNCKPHVLIPLLEDGCEEVIWLDSDIILARNPSYLFDNLAPDVLVGTEEPMRSPNQGSAVRATGWKFRLGRNYPVTLNTCVLRATKCHLPLLRKWKELLHNQEYVYWQEQAIYERPVHMMSDQDVLNALIGSKDYESAQVRYLREGRDVIHAGGALGHSLSARFAGLFHRIPPFIHGAAGKPWYIFDPVYRAHHSRWFTFYRRLSQEVSPYVTEARKYRSQVGMPCPWMTRHSPFGVLLRAVGFGHFALRGLPLTAAATLISSSKEWLFSRNVHAGKGS